MRVFVAAGLPENVVQAAQEAQKTLRLMGIKGSFVSPEAMHATLVFLGETPDSDLERIKTRLCGVECSGFQAWLGNPGVFPDWSHARVAWLGLKGDGWQGLHGAVAKALHIKPEFGFVPHLTLARIKAVDDKQKFRQGFCSIHVPALSFRVHEFRLMGSQLAQKGAVHTELAVFRLA
jgi:RNA 2',3'-cyclic 3'-phosphodiesterase